MVKITFETEKNILIFSYFIHFLLFNGFSGILNTNIDFYIIFGFPFSMGFLFFILFHKFLLNEIKKVYSDFTFVAIFISLFVFASNIISNIYTESLLISDYLINLLKIILFTNLSFMFFAFRLRPFFYFKTFYISISLCFSIKFYFLLKNIEYSSYFELSFIIASLIFLFIGCCFFYFFLKNWILEYFQEKYKNKVKVKKENFLSVLIWAIFLLAFYLNFDIYLKDFMVLKTYKENYYCENVPYGFNIVRYKNDFFIDKKFYLYTNKEKDLKFLEDYFLNDSYFKSIKKEKEFFKNNSFLKNLEYNLSKIFVDENKIPNKFRYKKIECNFKILEKSGK